MRSPRPYRRTPRSSPGRRSSTSRPVHGEPGAVVLQHRLACLRVDLAVRRRIHHLQHLLDHRRPADQGTRPAAGRRREPGPGLPLGAARGGRRGLGVVAVGLGLGVPPPSAKALLNGFGITLPSGRSRSSRAPRSSVLVVGVGVTVVSAIRPARARRADPAGGGALDRAAEAGPAATAAPRLGYGVTVLGVVAARRRAVQARRRAGGLGRPSLSSSASRMLAPAVARPLSGVLGRPLAACSAPRASSAGRTPCAARAAPPRRRRRSWSGWPWSSAMAVFGASLSTSATSSVDQAISADLLVSANRSGQLSDSVAAAARRSPGSPRPPPSTGTSSSSGGSLAALTGGVDADTCRHRDPADDRGLAAPSPRASCSSTPAPPPKTTCRSGTA